MAGVRNVRCDVSERYKGVLRRIIRGHGQGRDQGVRYNRFCEAQVLRTAVIVPSGPDSPLGRELTREDADYVWWFEHGARDA